jgi:drug/metabolite transporter (DMT)-like permease
MSLLNFVFSNGLSTWGVQYISAGLGAIIGAIFPLWLLIIGLFANQSKLKPQAIIGLVIGFAGVCFIFTEHLHDLLNPYFRFGIFISVISTWTWAFGTLYTKKHAATFNPYFSLGLQMVISGTALFSISHATGNAIALAAIPWQSWSAIGFLTVFSSIITFIAFIYALQHLPVEQVSLYAYVNPIVAVALGWLLFDEKLTLVIVCGVLVTLFGVYLVNRSK